MKFLVGAATCVTFAALSVSAASESATTELTFPQKRGATFDEIHLLQALGRVQLDPAGRFFLYEWSRPYDWAPDATGLPAAAGARKQTFMYKVDTTAGNPTSQLLFQPAPGATYYLGTLSPNAENVSFYEIDRDDNKVRAAVVQTNGGLSPKITWFDTTPDVARLDLPAAWLSNDELTFPVKTGFARLAAAGGPARECAECAELVAKSGSSKPGGQPAAKDLPEGARLLAQIEDGALAVFAIDSAEVLKLMYRKQDATYTLFDNARIRKKPAAGS
jgi:hypothetical protein